MFEEIRAALMRAHPADIPIIKRYIAWVAFRRQIHNQFYFKAHWVNGCRILSAGEGSRTAHWVGQ